MGQLTQTTAEIQKQINGVYGEVYTDLDTPYQQATVSTAVKFAGFASNGESSNCTADATNNKLTITESGDYRITCFMSFGGGNNQTWRGYVYVGGVEQSEIMFDRKMSANGDLGSASMGGIITVDASGGGVDIEVYISCTSSSTFNCYRANLSTNRIGF